MLCPSLSRRWQQIKQVCIGFRINDVHCANKCQIIYIKPTKCCVCIFCKTGFNYLKGNVVGYYCFSHLEPDLNEKLNVSGLIDLYKCDVFNLHLFI